MSQGRAVGYLVFAFLQDPRKETVRMRHLFPQSLGLRLRDREEVAMVLGDGAVHAGALCHKISRDTPGVGYVLGENNRPVRVRAGYVSDDMIRLAAQRFRAPQQIPIVVPVAEPDAAAARRPGPGRRGRGPRRGVRRHDDPLADRLRLVEFARLHYRQLILQDAGLPEAWADVTWLEEAACRYAANPDFGMCEACPVVEECLAAALLLDDPARVRGGLDRRTRSQLWIGLEARALQTDPWIGDYGTAG